MRAEKLLSGLYPHLPIPVQQAACSLQGWRDARLRYGSYFHRKLADLNASDRWGSASIQAFQDEQVARIVRRAYDHVPFYRNAMLARGLSPSDVRSVADLPKLPIVTKEDLRAALPGLIADDFDRRRLILRHTSGTSGKSLMFYSTAESMAFQWAVWWRHRMRFGLRYGDLNANFTGKIVTPVGQRKPPYWRWNWPARQALINMQHVTPEKVADIVGFLGRHDFIFYSGYPSIIHSLALYALERGLSLPAGPRVITTGAEPLYDFQRRDITRLTGAILTDQWGFSEGAGNASQCERHGYHEDFEFGVLECIEAESLPGRRKRGRVVCTGFANDAFPLIRYDVGDFGIWEDPGARCTCGRESRVLVCVEGRQEDCIITPEGHRVMRFDYVFKETGHIKECQVVQAAPGEITLRIVRRPEYSAADERHLQREINRWISPSLAVQFEYVHGIEREPNGKFRAVKSLMQKAESAV